MDFWYAITLIGSPELWAAVCIILAALYTVAHFTFWRPKEKRTVRKKYKGILILLILSFTITFLLVSGLKTAFAVPRVCEVCPAAGCNPYCPLDYSFPSGHSATIFTLFMSIWIINRGRKDWLALALALLVSYSRIALGVHTLVDLVGGAAIGVVVVIMVWKLEKHLNWGQITPKIK